MKGGVLLSSALSSALALTAYFIQNNSAYGVDGNRSEQAGLPQEQQSQLLLIYWLCFWLPDFLQGTLTPMLLTLLKRMFRPECADLTPEERSVEYKLQSAAFGQVQLAKGCLYGVGQFCAAQNPNQWTANILGANVATLGALLMFTCDGEPRRLLEVEKVNIGSLNVPRNIVRSDNFHDDDDAGDDHGRRSGGVHLEEAGSARSSSSSRVESVVHAPADVAEESGRVNPRPEEPSGPDISRPGGISRPESSASSPDLVNIRGDDQHDPRPDQHPDEDLDQQEPPPPNQLLLYAQYCPCALAFTCHMVYGQVEARRLCAPILPAPLTDALITLSPLLGAAASAYGVMPMLHRRVFSKNRGRGRRWQPVLSRAVPQIAAFLAVQAFLGVLPLLNGDEGRAFVHLDEGHGHDLLDEGKHGPPDEEQQLQAIFDVLHGAGAAQDTRIGYTDFWDRSIPVSEAFIVDPNHDGVLKHQQGGIAPHVSFLSGARRRTSYPSSWARTAWDKARSRVRLFVGKFGSFFHKNDREDNPHDGAPEDMARRTGLGGLKWPAAASETLADHTPASPHPHPPHPRPTPPPSHHPHGEQHDLNNFFKRAVTVLLLTTMQFLMGVLSTMVGSSTQQCARSLARFSQIDSLTSIVVAPLLFAQLVQLGLPSARSGWFF